MIPNFSALSEAGASLVDRRLGTYIVPRTEIASLASPAFFYDWIDRNAFERTRKPRPLPLKPGSFQLFARGFTDGSVFLRDHPWPTGDEDSASAPAHRRHKRSVFSACCGRAGHFDDDGAIAVNGMAPASHAVGGFTWTEDLMAEFRAELGASAEIAVDLTALREARNLRFPHPQHGQRPRQPHGPRLH